MNKIYVTDHCLLRFKQRFSLKFPSHYFINKQFTANLIIELINTSYKDSLTKYCPFYMNKCKTFYPDTTIVYQPQKNIYFALVIRKNKIEVKTCFKSFDPRYL